MSHSELLDPAAYSDPMTFQAERKAIFGAGWQVIGPTASFAQQGSYTALGLGGWPLFAIKSADGAIRGFRNVCAHQKMPVLDNGRGVCAQIRCRFHGWTYDNAGQLVSTPQPVAPEDGDLSKHRLDDIPSVNAGGLVFIRLDGADDEPPLSNDVGLAQLDHLHAEVRSLPHNWKSVLDVLVDGPATPTVSNSGRFDWLRPTTCIWHEPEGALVLQVVPRTFRKTELHLHLLGASEGQLSERAQIWLNEIAGSTEAWQSSVEAGENIEPATIARLSPLHGWIKARMG